MDIREKYTRKIINAVRPTSGYNHITPVLNFLHWLPIAKQIQFKIAVITFKALNLKQPSYLSDLWVPVQPSARRSHSNTSFNFL